MMLRSKQTRLWLCALGLACISAMGGCMLLLDEPYESGTRCTGSDDYCSCAEANTLDEPNTYECTPESVGHGVCCSDSLNRCYCHSFSCDVTSDGCDCSPGSDYPDHECGGPVCCAQGTSCRCIGIGWCFDSEVQVDACKPELLPCYDGEVQVSECSDIRLAREG